MKRSDFSTHKGLVIVGMIATAALLLETRLPVPQDIHFLLQLLWVGVGMGSLFVVMIQPTIQLQTRDDFSMGLSKDDIPEWRDPDRTWMQKHPDEPYIASDIDKEEV